LRGQGLAGRCGPGVRQTIIELESKTLRKVTVAKPKTPKTEDDRDKRIEDLKRHAEELCGGQMKTDSLFLL
jgi:hypothetical protein